MLVPAVSGLTRHQSAAPAERRGAHGGDQAAVDDMEAYRVGLVGGGTRAVKALVALGDVAILPRLLLLHPGVCVLDRARECVCVRESAAPLATFSSPLCPGPSPRPTMVHSH